ncbi:hypothetical protein [Streptacidiphilus neutrinimicus]|uniref:hypothetical protein n=1 Tax=Streptacidiphilus neutrinimicus TaxID=105420 RepID=UPI0005AA8157|nr:hypothetical protein [Streptacidiphilus neutrinimicus]
MRKTLTLTFAAACLALSACSSSSTSSSSDHASTGTNGTPTAAPAQPTTLTAAQIMAKLIAAVPSAKQTIVYTASTDPNSLLGRPGQYTADIRFSDNRVPKDKTQFATAGDVEFGGAVETFATVQDAQTRAAYVEKVTQAMASLAGEYDFQHGHVLIRVSRFLTPDQVAAYKTFANTLP